MERTAASWWFYSTVPVQGMRNSRRPALCESHLMLLPQTETPNFNCQPCTEILNCCELQALLLRLRICTTMARLVQTAVEEGLEMEPDEHPITCVMAQLADVMEITHTMRQRNRHRQIPTPPQQHQQHALPKRHESWQEVRAAAAPPAARPHPNFNFNMNSKLGEQGDAQHSDSTSSTGGSEPGAGRGVRGVSRVGKKRGLRGGVRLRSTEAGGSRGTGGRAAVAPRAEPLTHQLEVDERDADIGLQVAVAQ
ncbi:hypothetical protein JKP88DRAFT_255371, partial [Tribonema minus]